MKNGDAVEALGFLAEFAGMKPFEFKQQLIQSLTPEVDRRRQLSPDQISNEKLQEENKYLERQSETERKQTELQQTRRELENRIVNLQQTHGINDEDFDQAYEELADTNLKDNLSPELVVDYLRHKAAFTKADEIIGKVQPSLSSNEFVVEAVEKIIFDNPDFSNEDIQEIVADIYGKEKKSASKAVSKKIQSKSEEQPKRTSEDYEITSISMISTNINI